MINTVTISQRLLPADGRSGAGPSKVGAEQVDAVVRAGAGLLGVGGATAFWAPLRPSVKA